MTTATAPDWTVATPPKAAKHIGCSHEQILGFIASGELRAVNLAANTAGRPRWRIMRADLDRFLAARSNTPFLPTRTAARRAKPKKRFFR